MCRGSPLPLIDWKDAASAPLEVPVRAKIELSPKHIRLLVAIRRPSAAGDAWFKHPDGTTPLTPPPTQWAALDD